MSINRKFASAIIIQILLSNKKEQIIDKPHNISEFLIYYAEQKKRGREMNTIQIYLHEILKKTNL